MHIRKDDIVEVITGDDAGTAANPTTGRVLRVLPDVHKWWSKASTAFTGT